MDKVITSDCHHDHYCDVIAVIPIVFVVVVVVVVVVVALRLPSSSSSSSSSIIWMHIQFIYI